MRGFKDLETARLIALHGLAVDAHDGALSEARDDWQVAVRITAGGVVLVEVGTSLKPIGADEIGLLVP